jgi:hypothetical protein
VWYDQVMVQTISNEFKSEKEKVMLKVRFFLNEPNGKP